MRILTNDGIELASKSARGLVRKMRSMAFNKSISKWDYMESVARRVGIWNDEEISTERASEFISDLVAARLITVVDESKEEEGGSI